MVMAEVQHRGHPSLVINQHRSDVHFHQTNFDLSHPTIKKKQQRVSLCVGCGGQILDQHILRVAPDLEWHAACLKCQECQQFLDESCTCFVRDGKTFCKRDYVRLFGTKCDKCGCSFSKSDFVMRAKSKIYHIECFRCSICARQLIPGDEFALRDGSSLFCKEDHDVLEKSNQNSLTLLESNNNNTTIQNNNSVMISSSRKMSLSNNHFSELGSVSDSESESESHKGIRGKQSGTSDGKPTRVRTVLNEKQLHTLRTCYNANPRPDALMKEQLVEMTSLSPRVIRVWFQNKRCKDKKKTIQMKLQMQQEKEGRKMGYNGLQGIPMIASSPVRHDSPLNFHGVEITSFQPPWKALSDFALHADLDNNGPVSHTPAFQHLINQMHGYEMGPMSHGTSLPNKPMHPTELNHHHHQSEDSYVTYLESDESSQESP